MNDLIKENIKKYVDSIVTGISYYIYSNVDTFEELDKSWEEKDNELKAYKWDGNKRIWPWPKVGEIPGEGHVRSVSNEKYDYIKTADGDWIQFAFSNLKETKISDII